MTEEGKDAVIGLAAFIAFIALCICVAVLTG